MIRARLVAALSVILTSAVLAKEPITHETLWLMKRVAAPKVSPDGKWVVFTVVEPAHDPKQQTSDLWLVAGDGSAKPRRITFSQGAESDVDWSPDSARIAFATKREGDEADQIYELDLAGGGEAQRVTSLSTGARAAKWSPDVKRILFESMLYPGAGDDEANKAAATARKERKYVATAFDMFPIRNWDRWLDDKQPHLFVTGVEPSDRARDLLAGSQLMAAAGYSGVFTNSGQSLEAAWAPDGQSVVFVATTHRNSAAYAQVPMHLYQVPAEGGEPRQLTAGPGEYSRPTFSPDGKALYALHTAQNASAYNLSRVAAWDWPAAAAPRILTQSFDRSVSSIVIGASAQTIYLTAEDAGHARLFAMPAAGGTVRTVLPVDRGAYGALSSPGSGAAEFLVSIWESSVNPPEVVRIDPGATAHRLLSEFNVEKAAAIDWETPRHFWHTSPSGMKIHSMLVLPPGFDESKKYPLLVLMHGGPHNMWTDQFVLRWNYHLLARPGYVVLLSNYRGSTGFGEKFAQAIQGDPLKGPGDDINQAADEAIRRFPFIDGTRQAAAGASYGGHLANWMQASTRRYKCLISHAGLINLESQWGASDTIYHREMNAGGPVWEQGPVWKEHNPIRYAREFSTPILLTVGERDYRVPLSQTIENWSVLQRLRVPSRLIVFHDSNHWIMKGEDSRFFYQEVHAWLARYLGTP
jgi:dipeptidyl aminopeptidase/acylaminoacyl peptidase